MDTTCNFNLKQISLYRAAISYWQHDDIKTEIIDFFKENHQHSQYLFDDGPWDSFLTILGERLELDKWKILTDNVIKKFDSLDYCTSLPEILKPELKLAIRQIGFQICKLRLITKFNVTQSKGYSDYIKKIHWKNNGTVDLAKTFQALWARNPKTDLDHLKSVGFNSSDRNLRNEILQEFKEHYNRYGNFALEYHISAHEEFYNDGYLPDVTSDIMETIKMKSRFPFSESQSVDENMFRFSAFEGLPKSVRYFWNKLNNEEKKFHLLNCVIMVVSCTKMTHFCKLDSYAEICLFLLSQMTNDDMIELFKDGQLDWHLNYHRKLKSHYRFKYYFLKLLLNRPWQPFFIRVLELIWLHNTEEKKTHEYLKLIVSAHNDRFFKLTSYNENMRIPSRIFCTAYCKVPNHIKTLFTNDAVKFLIDGLIEIGDLSAIKLITHDPLIKLDIEKVYKAKASKWLALAAKNEFELLDGYLSALMSDPNERQKFKCSIDIQEVMKQLISLEKSNMLKTEYFASLDKFIDWRCSSLEEKDFKKSVKIPVRYQFLNKNDGFDFIKKFSNWQCRSPEEVQNFKDCLKDHQFTWDEIVYDFTMEDTKAEETNLEEFLSWLFGSAEEAEEFRRVKFVQNRTFLIRSMKQALNEQLTLYKRFDEMFKWCFLSQEKIQELKHRLFEEAVIEVCDKNFKASNHDEICGIIKWALEEEDEVRDFMKEFIMTGKRLDRIHSYQFMVLPVPANTGAESRNDALQEMLMNSFKLSMSQRLKERGGEIMQLIGFVGKFLEPLKDVTRTERKYGNNECIRFDENEFENNKILLREIISNVNVAKDVISSVTR